MNVSRVNTITEAVLSGGTSSMRIGGRLQAATLQAPTRIVDPANPRVAMSLRPSNDAVAVALAGLRSLDDVVVTGHFDRAAFRPGTMPSFTRVFDVDALG